MEPKLHNAACDTRENVDSSSCMPAGWQQELFKFIKTGTDTHNSMHIW